ncbi:MAG: hypothetical protein ABEI86_11670, partial [Halobacteriaceae archaeon]
MSTPLSTLPVTPVRRSVSELIPELEHLTINNQMIEDLAKKIADEEFPLPEWRAPVFPDKEEPEVTN